MTKPTLDDILTSFDDQSQYCKSRQANVTASVIDGAVLNIRAGGPLLDLVEGFDSDPGKAALALRVAGAVHYLLIKGRADALAKNYAKAIPFEPAAFAGILSELIDRNRPEFERFLVNPPQTNEVNRIAALLPAFATIAVETGLPLDLYELGTSGGLLLAPDRCEIDYGGFQWGNGPIALKSEWRGETPSLPKSIVVDGRYGVDQSPVDYSDPEQLDRARSFFWPEDTERKLRFEEAVLASRSVDCQIEKADALEWLSRQAIPRHGAASVVFSSVFSVYLSNEQTGRLDAVLEQMGSKASDASPLAFVQFEPEKVGDFVIFNVDLTMWPAGKKRRIATAASHAQWVEPHANSDHQEKRRKRI